MNLRSSSVKLMEFQCLGLIGMQLIIDHGTGRFRINLKLNRTPFSDLFLALCIKDVLEKDQLFV